MGQCVGVDLLREDIESMRKDHAKMSAELSKLKEVFGGLDDEMQDNFGHIKSNMVAVSESIKPIESQFDFLLEQTTTELAVLKKDVVSAHRDAVEISQNYQVLRKGLQKLEALVLSPQSPQIDIVEVKSIDIDSDIISSLEISTSFHSKGLSRPATQYIGKAFSPTDLDAPERAASTGRGKGSSGKMKRGVTTPNMGKHKLESDAKLGDSSNSLGETVTVELEHGESLGLILQRHYKTLRNGNSLIAQLVVTGYISNGVSANRGYQAGILVDDVICGVNGSYFASHDELAAALIKSYEESDEVVQIIHLVLSQRGDASGEKSKKRWEKAEVLARTKKVVITRSAGRKSQNSAQLKGNERKIEHVRKEEHAGVSVAKCGLGVWKFIVHRVTTKAFRKRLGKTLRKYCCPTGFNSKDKHEDHNNHHHQSIRRYQSKVGETPFEDHEHDGNESFSDDDGENSQVVDLDDLI